MARSGLRIVASATYADFPRKQLAPRAAAL
jgi:hypothetical protein